MIVQALADGIFTGAIIPGSTPIILGKWLKSMSPLMFESAFVVIAVSTPPGHTRFTRIPSAASSTASAFMNMMSPALEAQ
jgi:hypothetical protein